ncbi:hypothetical protein M1293_01260 [Candidatus Parvarchaeota archaeon]|nr:hypothetical protein [Candidatus Parvarchaeota archaeon]
MKKIPVLYYVTLASIALTLFLVFVLHIYVFIFFLFIPFSGLLKSIKKKRFNT